MQEKIKRFNNYIISLNKENIPTGLFEGKMGVCIYLFHQSRYYNSDLYLKHAKEWLNAVYSDISKISASEKNINFKHGLTGICYGVIYLIENEFIKGNVNAILKDLDDAIFSVVCFLDNNFTAPSEIIENLLSCLFYFTKRIEDSSLSDNEKNLFQELVVKIINNIERYIYFKEIDPPIHFLPFEYYTPIYFWLLSNIYKLEFYNYKIENIYINLICSSFHTIPMMRSLRLLLLCSLRSMRIINSEPNEIVNLLNNDRLKISEIINHEFYNRNILPYDGLSGFYFFLKKFKLFTEEDKYAISNRIKNSELWDDFEYGNDKEKESFVGLVNGMGGAVLAYQECARNKY